MAINIVIGYQTIFLKHLDKQTFLVYNSAIHKCNDEEEYAGYPYPKRAAVR